MVDVCLLQTPSIDTRKSFPPHHTTPHAPVLRFGLRHRPEVTEFEPEVRESNEGVGELMR